MLESVHLVGHSDVFAYDVLDIFPIGKADSANDLDLPGCDAVKFLLLFIYKHFRHLRH